MVEGGLPQRPQSDAAPSVSGWIAPLQLCRDAGDLLLRLRSSNAGPQAHIRFDPSRTPVLELITSASKSFLHRCGNPELDGSAYKGSIESLGRDADDGMRHVVQALDFPDDRRIAFEPCRPKLVAAHYQSMPIGAQLLSCSKASADNRMNAESGE